MALLTDKEFRTAIKLLPFFRKRVMDFDTLLAKISAPGIEIPGETIERIAEFQKNNLLVADGILGDKTASKIRGLDWEAPKGGYSLVLGDKLIQIDSVVVKPQDPGSLSFRHISGSWKDRFQDKPPNLIILHWDVAKSSYGCYQTLIARKLSVHFMVDKDGIIYQGGDPSKMTTYHALGVNDRSIGIEINSPATLLSLDDKDNPRPTGALGVRGSTQEVLYFYPIQVRSVLNLVGALCSFYLIPRTLPGSNNKVSIDTDYRTSTGKFTGICGHYHCSNKGKIDPGVGLWESFLKEGYQVA